MIYCFYFFGFYFSFVFVLVVNKVIFSYGFGIREGWLGDNDLNKDRLDFFYWFLVLLSFVNFFNYFFWLRWYLFGLFVIYYRVEVNSLEDLEDGVNKDFKMEKLRI